MQYHFRIRKVWTTGIEIFSKLTRHKTSIQWTPGSQVYLNIKKKSFGQKMIFEQKQIRKMHKSCIIND